MSDGLLAVCFRIEKKNLASVALGSLVGVSGAILSTNVSLTAIHVLFERYKYRESMETKGRCKTRQV